MKKFVPIEKQSKKNQREFFKRQRTASGFNTGTRYHKNKKSDYNRQETNRETKEILNERGDNND